MMEPQDPGWPISLKGLWIVFVPWLAQRQARKGLTSLRVTFIAFVNAIILFGVVLPFLGPYNGSNVAAALVVLGVGVYALVSRLCVRRVERRSPLKCENLGGSYQTRFFLRIAFAEAAALFGFVGVFVVHVLWIYYPCALFTLIGFAHAAPTRASIERDQVALNNRGCGNSLLAELVGKPDNI
jgi:F0F1-type ATP synthase membrane subunit c/vacuolar-type H+-ATPase subunit K